MPRVQEVDRRRIICVYERGEDFVEAARVLNIPRTTAYSIIRRFQQTGERVAANPAGGRKRKLDDESVDFLALLIECNPTITLQELRSTLYDLWPHKPRVALSTIQRCLDGQLITLKACNDVPGSRNSLATKDSRVEYAQWMYTEGLQQHRIYIDETGFNLYTRRHYGRAPIGQRVHRRVGNNRGQNISVIVAVSNFVGLVYYEISHVPVNREIFHNFMTSHSVILGDERAVLIMDNATCHGNVELHSDNLQVKYLPPNSPFLNPIENCFSVFKNDMKRRLNWVQGEVCDRRAAAAANMSMVSWRKSIMEREITRSIDVINQDITANNYRHSNEYLPRCIRREDIFH